MSNVNRKVLDRIHIDILITLLSIKELNADEDRCLVELLRRTVVMIYCQLFVLMPLLVEML